MVRLKDFEADGSSPMARIFQFQYGSIKSVDRDSIILLLNGFQFQYGSIKRCS